MGRNERKNVYISYPVGIYRSLIDQSRTLIRNSEPCTESTFRKQKASTGSIKIWNQIKSTSPCSRNVRHARGEQWKGVQWSIDDVKTRDTKEEWGPVREAMSRKRVKSGPATTEALNNRFLINASRGSWSALLGLSLVELKRDCSTTCCSRLKPIAACTWRIQKEILLILLRNVGETCVIL